MPITLYAPSGAQKQVTARSGTRYVPADGTGAVTVPDTALGDVNDLLSAGFTPYYFSSSISKVQRAVSAANINGPQVSSIGAALQVTRGASNAGPVSSTQTPLCAGTYADMKAAAVAKRFWTPSPASAYAFAGPPAGYYMGTNLLNGSVGISMPLNFVLNAQTFEFKPNGQDPNVTIMVDGAWLFSSLITQNITNGVFSGATWISSGTADAYVKVDFGSRATRRIQLNLNSSGQIGNFCLGDVKDTVAAWDRSDEPLVMVFSDSYGQAPSTQWDTGGPYREACYRLGLQNFQIDAIGGTGYAQTATQNALANSGRSRIDNNVIATPDMVIFAFGLNDNANISDWQYGSANAALAGFTTAVNYTLSRARARYPNAIIVVIAPPSPPGVNANFATQGLYNNTKMQVILSAVRNIAGPWVWVDTFLDFVQTSSGYAMGPLGVYQAIASSPNPSGASWITGTGRVGATTGDGLGDIYISDGTHPNAAGCVYLGTRLANALRPALMSL